MKQVKGVFILLLFILVVNAGSAIAQIGSMISIGGHTITEKLYI